MDMFISKVRSVAEKAYAKKTKNKLSGKYCSNKKSTVPLHIKVNTCTVSHAVLVWTTLHFLSSDSGLAWNALYIPEPCKIIGAWWS